MNSTSLKHFKTHWFKSLAIAIGVLSPFLILSFFNYPSSDDFSFHQQLAENGLWESLKQLYNGWTGRMTSFFLLFILDPLADKSFLCYQLLSSAIIVLFFYSVLKASQSVFIFNTSSNLLSFSLTAYIIYFLPDTADFFYWFITSYSYTLGLIFWLGWLVMYSNYAKKKWAQPFLVLLPIFITGACELSLILFCILAGFIIFESWQKRKINAWVLFGIIVGAVSGLIWITAPGNAVRSESFEKIYEIQTHSLAFATLAAAKKTLFIYFDWLVKKPTIPILLLLAIIAFKQKILPFNKLHTTIKLLIGITFMPILLLVYYWSTGIYFVPLRLINYGFVVFCLFSIPSAVLLIQPYIKKYVAYQKVIVYSSLIVLFVMLAIRSNLRWAVQDLTHASAYKSEIETRVQLLTQSKNQVAILPSIKHPLRTTFFADIDSLPSHWYNKGLAWYYGVEEVRRLD